MVSPTTVAHFKDFLMSNLFKAISVACFLAIFCPSALCQEQQGGIAINQPWARAGKPNSAAFMKLKNTTDQDRKIVSASTDCAQRIELHDHLQEGDVMKMRKVESIMIPAGGEIELMPGGKHVMLFGLGNGLEAGQDINLTLTLDNGEFLNLVVPVKPMTHNPKLAASGCNCNH
jgi:copper(I)-binding protein